MLSSSSSSVNSCGIASSCLLSFSFSLHPSAYLLPFLRGFCLRWKGNHGALRVTGPAVFFSSREDLPPPPSPRLSLSRLVPFRRSFFVRFIRAKRSPRPAQTPSSPTRNDKIVHFCQPPSAITGFFRIAAGSIARYLFPLSPWYIHIAFYVVCS